MSAIQSQSQAMNAMGGSVLVSRGTIGSHSSYSLPGLTNSALWTVSPDRPSIISITAGAGSNIDLPPIASSALDVSETVASLGHQVLIINEGAQSFGVRNSVGTLLITLSPQRSARFVASSVAASGWSVLETQVPMRPTLIGSAFGLDTYFDDGLVSLGSESFVTHATVIPNGNIQTTQALGKFNLQNFDQTTQLMQNNCFISDSLLLDSSGVNNINGNVILGCYGLSKGNVTNLASNIFVSGSIGDSAINGILNFPDASNNIILATQDNVFATQQTLGTIMLSNAQVINIGNRNLIFANENTQLNSIDDQIIFNVGAVALDNGGFSDVTVFQGQTAVVPNANSQFCLSYQSLRAPNLVAVSPTSAQQQLMCYDTSLGQIRQVDPAGVLKRTYATTGTTDASGDIVLSLAFLGLATVPNVTHSVRNASLTVFYGSQTTAVSAGSVSIKVFQSIDASPGLPTMEPAPAGVIVDIIVCY